MVRTGRAITSAAQWYVHRAMADRRPPRFAACISGRPELVRRLLEEVWTRLWSRAATGTAFARRCSSRPVRAVHHRTWLGDTPLSVASALPRSGVARLLLDDGAEVDRQGAQGRSSFLWACLKGREACARLLLDSGTQVAS
mmetsp:Transcript_15557/g.52530  ORF Transcript_15557/g.52530 Transcript_15557/m.52530 type:complete len:141 (+) Transcript_15557:307-729(+)